MPHQVPHTIPRISSKSRTNYKQQLKISSKLLLVKVLPTSHPTHLTSMSCSVRTPFLVLQGASQTLRLKQDINMKWQVKTHSRA